MTATQAAPEATELDLRMIPIGDIAPDPNQPRKTFDDKSIEELGASLKAGQTNAIKVRPYKATEAGENFPSDVKWIIVHGERRLRAAHKAGVARLRAEVAWKLLPTDPALLLEQIVDNLQDESLGAVEEAAAIRRYAEISQLGTRELAATIGKNQMYVSIALGMGDLPADLLEKIERDARGDDGDGYTPSWRHMRQLNRLKDHPEALDKVYADAVVDRASSRDLEDAVNDELQYIENERQYEERQKKAAAEAKASPQPGTTPINAIDEREKRKRLDKARMTRVRKDLIRGNLPEILLQVAEIAKGIKLPEGFAAVAAGRVSKYDLARVEVGSSTNYVEDVAQLVVPELPGEWTSKAARLGAASTGGRWAKDDEAGRQWLAFAYWLATATRGMDKELDRQAADVLRDRDKPVAEKAKAAKPAKQKEPEMVAITCVQAGCGKVFYVKRGPGRRRKYCGEHRSK